MITSVSVVGDGVTSDGCCAAFDRYATAQYLAVVIVDVVVSDAQALGVGDV